MHLLNAYSDLYFLAVDLFYLALLLQPLGLNALPDLALTAMDGRYSKLNKFELVIYELRNELLLNGRNSEDDGENTCNVLLELTVCINMANVQGICGRCFGLKDCRYLPALCRCCYSNMEYEVLWTFLMLMALVNGGCNCRTWHGPWILQGAAPYSNPP